MNDRMGIEAKVLRAVISAIPGISSAEISADTELFNIGLDSLNAVELVVRLEDEFGIEFQFDEIQYESFRTVSAISEMVSGKVV